MITKWAWAVVVLFSFMGEVLAGAFSDYLAQEELQKLGPVENCGHQPPEPGLLGSMYNSPQKNAINNFYACRSRNERRQTLKSTSDMQDIVSRATASCQNSVRRMSSNPPTLSFDSVKSFSWMGGLNGSGVDTTDGGYSIGVSGSDIRGRFSVTCYMNKSYNVTNVK